MLPNVCALTCTTAQGRCLRTSVLGGVVGVSTACRSDHDPAPWYAPQIGKYYKTTKQIKQPRKWIDARRGSPLVGSPVLCAELGVMAAGEFEYRILNTDTLDSHLTAVKSIICGLNECVHVCICQCCLQGRSCSFLLLQRAAFTWCECELLSSVREGACRTTWQVPGEQRRCHHCGSGSGRRGQGVW